ncbi:salicylate hydroxylase [Capronia epimyces CBS 606.96]|uniref:Salicylate hydroxylase n=1 Tax=Capronia epimyces CBS 606.96 TaxID=1182542 RepID=W9XV69_9EURO|nr:salicylate hydroxylase [Capronia epimyces CBS 606.96]EXJ81250.1 salicylate hydroxylase [Capronia epimyces CBS 606.96]
MAEVGGQKLDIVIVGAGLAGLAAAISCALGNHNVCVLEAAKELAEIGAGLQITPNASRLFRDWGLGNEIETIAAEPTLLAVHRYSDGKILAEEKEFNEKMRRKYGSPFIDVHRVDLQRIMYNKAKTLGVTVELNCRVSSIGRSPTGPEVTLESGRKLHGDLVVGADGLWSKCRECLLDRADKPLPTGDLAYRIVLELDKITDPELRRWVANPQVHFWIGPHAHAVAYSLRAGTMCNIVLLCPDDLPSGLSKTKGSVSEMKRLFSGWDPILTRFLDQVDEVDKWKLMHREELESWTNPRKDLLLIGDSCHPMLPYLAQGANSSVEDGGVLGRLLSYVKSKDQIPWAIRLYEDLRKSRSEIIARETFRQRDAFHMPDGEAQRVRDSLFASQLGKEISVKFPSRWTCPEFQPWLYGYDAYHEADEAVKSQPFQAEAEVCRRS